MVRREKQIEKKTGKKKNGRREDRKRERDSSSENARRAEISIRLCRDFKREDKGDGWSISIHLPCLVMKKLS